MEHLRVVVLTTDGIQEAIDGLGQQIETLAARWIDTSPTGTQRYQARVAACMDARTTLQEALTHPVHPHETHEEATR